MFELLVNKKQTLKNGNIDFLKGYLKDLAKEFTAKGFIILEQSTTHFAYMDDDQIVLCEIA
jgi:hypothetical protein